MQDPTVERWAASGAMALTGPVAHPLGPPFGLMERLDRLARRSRNSMRWPSLANAPRSMGLWRRGSTSCGGSCRLLPSSEAGSRSPCPGRRIATWCPPGSISSPPTTEPATWSAVREAFPPSRRRCPRLLERAVLLGLPVARVGEVSRPPSSRPASVMLRHASWPGRGRRPLLPVGRAPLWRPVGPGGGATSSKWNPPPGPTAPAAVRRLLRPSQRRQAIGGLDFNPRP